MKWTTDKPTMPGWYWFRGRVAGRPYDTEIVSVQHEDYKWDEKERMHVPDVESQLVGWCSDDDYEHRFDQFIGEWAGPIEPPQED